MKTIAFILWTNGLEYDDRVRKETRSLQELGNYEIKIFAVSGDNKRGTGITSYGIPYELIDLPLRNSLGKSRLSQICKSIQMYCRIIKRVRKFDLLWIIDDQPWLFPLAARKKMVWDLHEIPAALIGCRFKNFLFRMMTRRCSAVIHANQERLEYLVKEGIIRDGRKHDFIRNFPDNEWMAGATLPCVEFQDFQKWLGDHEYIYIQGINNSNRFPYETLSAVLEAKKTKAVVIGDFSSKVKQQLEDKYGQIGEFVYFAGQVNQAVTAPFIGNCKFSMVFYSTETANNRLCEPNRLFQCLAFGKPAIVGNNPTMANLISEHNNGIVLASSGGCIEENVAAIHKMNERYEEYQKHAEACRKEYMWESQSHNFLAILGINNSTNAI